MSDSIFCLQYPAMKWLMYEDDPDMYDARMRDWYIKSAASPKVKTIRSWGFFVMVFIIMVFIFVVFFIVPLSPFHTHSS